MLDDSNKVLVGLSTKTSTPKSNECSQGHWSRPPQEVDFDRSDPGRAVAIISPTDDATRLQASFSSVNKSELDSFSVSYEQSGITTTPNKQSGIKIHNFLH